MDCAPGTSSVACCKPSCRAWKAAQQARIACSGAAQALPCGPERTYRPLEERSSQAAALLPYLRGLPRLMGWQLCHWVSYMLVATCAELHEDLPIWAKMRVTYTAAVTRIHTMLCTAFAAIDWPGLDIDCDVSSCSRAQGCRGCWPQQSWSPSHPLHKARQPTACPECGPLWSGTCF